MEKVTQYLIKSTVHTSEVRAWEEDILLPTYEIGKEEKNPIFLEKRVYQGSSGSVTLPCGGKDLRYESGKEISCSLYRE